MRVRITKVLKGSIDGIEISRLLTGHVYDVNTSLACYLLSERMAEPADDEGPAAVAPVTKDTAERVNETRRGIILPRSIAADRRQTRKRSKRRGPS